MVASGYLEIPNEQKKEIVVDIDSDGSIISKNVKVLPDFILVVSDPKRNRNKIGDNAYFTSDGGKSGYLIVSKKIDEETSLEYMCRSGTGHLSLDRKYVCTPPGYTGLSITR